MAVNTAYLNTAASPAGFSDISQRAGSQWSCVNLEVTSGLTVAGVAQFNSTVSLVGALSLGNVSASVATVSTLLNSTGSTSLTSIAQTIVATTVGANQSAQTTFSFNAARVGDLVIAAPGASGVSTGLAYNAFVSAASTIAIRFSNVSAAAAVQSADTWTFYRFRVV